MTRVLIVDRRQQGRQLLRALLEGQVSHLVEALDGTQALALARQDPPDLVVSNLVLPGMDGGSLLHHWKADERLRAIPFVACCPADNDLKDEQLALDLGANAVIREPVEPQVFMARIRDVLAGASRQAGERLAAGPAGTATAVRDAQGRDRRMQIAVAAAVGTLVALILAGLAVSLAVQRRHVIEDSERTAQNLAKAIEEHASGSVNAVDVALASVARAIQLLPGRQKPRDAEIHDLLRANLRSLPFVRAIWILDANGDMIHDSDNLPGNYKLSDRAYFLVHRDDATQGLYIDPPILSKLGVWFVGASRRIDNPDQGFGGVVVAAIEPRYFDTFYGSIAVGNSGALALLRPDGTLIARAPVVENFRGKTIGPRPKFVDLLSKADTGNYHTTSAVDGVARIYAYRKVQGRPFVVQVGLGEAESLTGWRASALSSGLAALALSALITWLGLVVLRELGRRGALNTALQASEERLRLTLDAAQMGTFDWDMPASRITWSRWHKQLWGFGPGEFGGTLEAIAQRVHPEDLPGVNNEVARCIAAREPFAREFRVVWPDASVHWMQTCGEFEFGGGGQPIRMRGAVLEITARKLAEEALRASEQRLHLILDGLGPQMFVGLLDTEGRLLVINRPSLEVAALRAEDVLGKPLQETYWLAYSEPVRQRVHAAFDRAALGQSVRYDEQIRIAEGQLHWIDFSLHPLRDDSGTVVFIVPSAIDITERKQAEQLLRETHYRLEEAQKIARLGSWQIDPVSEQGYWSSQMFSIYGRDPRLGVPSFAEFLELVHPQDRDTVRDAYARTFKARQRCEIDFRGHPSRETLRHFSGTFDAECDAAGEVTRMAGTVIDITERKQAQAQLQASHNQLRALAARLDAVREEESSRLSHELHDELGQAMAGLKLDLSTLGAQLARLEPTLVGRVGAMQAQIDDMVRTTRDIARRLRPRVLDDLGLLAAIDAHAGEVCRRAGCRFEMVTDMDSEVVADPKLATAVFRIAQEALTNIARHAAATCVDIALHAQSGCLVMEIRDNGRGIPADWNANRGTLGILGMRERAAAVGGEVTVEGFPRQGTVVTLSIPDFASVHAA